MGGRSGVWFVIAFGLGCGGRTELGAPLEENDASTLDVRSEHAADVVIVPDTSPPPPPPPPDSGPLPCPDFTGDPTPTATVDLGTACDEGENTSFAPSQTCGTSGPAWEWVPDHDMAVSRIELWVMGGNQVAFYADDNGVPGTRLFIGSTGGAASDPQAWHGADVNPPISVKACHRYYVHQVVAGPCSWANGGVWVREFTPRQGGGWDGPFPGQWTARLLGACQ